MKLGVRLAQLESAQLVRHLAEEEPAFMFKHALVQDTAYHSLLVKTRCQIHHHVAEAYEQLFPNRLDEFATILAQHYAQAGDDTKIVHYEIIAADRAVRLGAHNEARAGYARALAAFARLPDTVENRRVEIDTLVKRTAISFTTASPEENLKNLAEAKSLLDRSVDAESVSVEDRLRRARIQLWIGRMRFYHMERRTAMESFRLVLPIATEIHDAELEAFAAALMGRILMWGGEYGQAQPWLEQGLAPLERNHNWMEWIVSCALLGVVIAARGDYRGGVLKTEQAVKRAEELHILGGKSLASSLLAIVHLMGGDARKMLAVSRTAVQVGVESGDLLPVYSGYATLAWAESRLGQHAAARTSLAQANAIAQKFGGRFLIEDWMAAIKTEMAFNEGKIEEAIMLAQDAVNFARSLDGHFAEGLAQRTFAQALAEKNPPEWSEAETHLARSLSLLEAGDARLEAARTHVAWGKILQRRGQARAAGDHFEQAAAQFASSMLEAELARVNYLREEVRVAH